MSHRSYNTHVLTFNPALLFYWLETNEILHVLPTASHIPHSISSTSQNKQRNFKAFYKLNALPAGEQKNTNHSRFFFFFRKREQHLTAFKQIKQTTFRHEFNWASFTHVLVYWGWSSPVGHNQENLLHTVKTSRMWSNVCGQIQNIE